MLLTALIMGIAGSLHCAGMCSPLAFAVTNLRSPAIKNRILYNAARITTYGILGTIAATIGYVLPLSKYQNLLSIILGSSLIIMALIGITGTRIPVITNALIRFTGILKSYFSKYISHKGPGAMLLLGSLNGLLPCGLTFLALSLCITLTNPLEGFIYMFVFGVGTLPVMLGLVSILDIIKNRMNWNISKVTVGLMMLSGILLIARVFIMLLPDGNTHELDLVDIVICR
jgi:sulfite exporter TauE/SafE